jgi:hypothetical protein
VVRQIKKKRKMKRSKYSPRSPSPQRSGGLGVGDMDSVALLALLKQMEVRDAMTLAISYKKVAVLMVTASEEIWRYWLRRDMGGYPVNPELCGVAKTTYLWYRFAIATMQRVVARSHERVLLYLNRLEGEVEDFESSCRQWVNDYETPIFDLLDNYIAAVDLDDELGIAYPTLNEAIREVYVDCIMELIRAMETGPEGTISNSYFMEPPRIVEQTNLIVASSLLYMDENAPKADNKMMEEHAKLIGAKSIHTFVNFNASDREDCPAGVVTRHESTSVVHPDAVPTDSLQYLIMVPIEGEHKDEEFADTSKLMEAIPQYAQRNPPAANDDKNWNPELGSENSFAGVFKKNDGTRETKHYICVQASVPTACNELRTFIAKNPGITYEQFVESPEYHAAHYVARRNAERIAYNVARAFKVPILHMEDTVASGSVGSPQRAVPTFSQTSSTVRAIGNQVGIFSKVRPVESAGSQKLHAVYESPYDGIVMYNMNGAAKGIGLPVTTGYGPNRQAVINAPVSEKRAKGIIWEGNAKIHPDMHKDSFISADSDEFMDAMRGTGWNDAGTKSLTRFVPVAVKIFNPEIKRIGWIQEAHMKKGAFTAEAHRHHRSVKEEEIWAAKHGNTRANASATLRSLRSK